jgi:23S rRNA pseudouridine2605 synthase
MKKTRLQKILARAGYGSRRGCEEIISSGKVTVNGEIAKLGCVVNSDDEIKVGSKKVEFIDVLNKPTGVICSKKTEGNLKSIYDLIPNIDNEKNLMIVGRLDANSSGLIFFTNDGKLSEFIAHPSNLFDREYLVRARGHFNDEIRENMLRGIKIDNQLLRLSDIVDGDKTNSNRWYTVCLLTGRNREIRKIFESQGLQVSRLKRVRFGPVFLPKGLKEGDWQELKSKDLEKMYSYGK